MAFVYCDVNLSTLPLDIIRNIIQLEVPESIDDLRLISPSWNFLVKELLNDKNRFPVIDNILFHFDDQDSSKLNYVEIFRITKFERHVTHLHSSNQKVNDRIRESSSFIIHILRAISRCVYIDTLTLELTTASAMENVQKYLGNSHIHLVIIKNLQEFGGDKRDALVNILLASKVQELEIHEVSSQALIDLEGPHPKNWYSLKFITLYNYYAPTDYGHQKALWQQNVQNINRLIKNCQANLYDAEHLNTPSRQCLRFRMAVLPS